MSAETTQPEPIAGPDRGPAEAPPGTCRPKRADAARNVERLVAVAREAFAEKGPDASLDDIARRAGVGPGTLYRHFPTRLALLEAVYREVVDGLCAEGERLRATEPPAEALIDWLRWFVGYVGEKHGLAAALTSAGGDHAVFKQSRERVYGIGGALLDDAKAAGAIRSDVALADLFSLVSAIAQAGERAASDTDLSERLLGLALDGLRTAPTGAVAVGRRGRR
jgi:AcrR family transcriptional regulator